MPKPPQYTGGFDGSAKPNPGEMTIGGWIGNPNRYIFHRFTKVLGHGSNNEAEYRAFIQIIKEAKMLGIKRISVRSDSALVVNHINRNWYIRSPKINALYAEALEAMEGIEVTISHVSRKYNKHADSLTKK